MVVYAATALVVWLGGLFVLWLVFMGTKQTIEHRRAE